MLDSRPKGRKFEPHCVVSLSKNINPSLVLVQPRKTRSYITERLLIEHKESNQTNKTMCSMQNFNIVKLVNVAEQTDLSLTWLETEDRFSRVTTIL